MAEIISSKQLLNDLAVKLFDIDAVKFGDFITKSGMPTSIYFDLRVIVSYPNIVDNITDLLINRFMVDEKCDHICGVPYAALSLASVVSVKSKIPMLIRRKEAKSYGTKKMVEGHFQKGDECVIIEDVITTGSSIIETIADLNDVGISASKAVVVLDREQKDKSLLDQKNINVKSLFTMTSLCDILLKNKKIDTETYEKTMKYIMENKFNSNIQRIPVMQNRINMSWSERMENTKAQITQKLLNIIKTKETNLCVAADLTSSTEILNLAEEIGDDISIFKIHVDIVEDFSDDFIAQLKQIAIKHNFLIMEDRKFADIGNTVALQFSRGIFKIAHWADLITVHSLSGEAVLAGISSAIPQGRDIGVFLLADMSSADNLLTPDYQEKTLSIAAKYPELITGIVCQSNLFKEPSWLQLTPGVKLSEGKDNLGQIYNSPERVIAEKGADLAVVGRGIINAKNRKQEAGLYKKALWEAYLKRVKN